MPVSTQPVAGSGAPEPVRIKITCGVCGGACQGFLCRRCLAEIERALGDLPADLVDLQAVATRQAHGPLGLGAGHMLEGGRDGRPAVAIGDATSDALGDAGWVFAWAAADQLWVIGVTLSTWIRHLCEQRGLQPPRASRGTYTTHRGLRVERNRMQVRTWRVFHPSPDQPVSPLIAWLLRNLDAVAQDEAAVQLHDEITSLPVANQRYILGRAPADEFYGLCDEPDVRVEQDGPTLTPRVGRCGTQLFGPRDAKQVDCPVCGASYTREQRHDSMVRELTDTLGTVRQVASTLTTLGRPVTIGQIDGWLRRGLIVSRGGTPRLVRVGDVLDRRAAMRKRRTTRRERMSA